MTIKPQNSTYRLQFNYKFTFKDAFEIIDYLNQLGITDIYSSPILKAYPKSMHGYDTTDYSMVNPELEKDINFSTFAAALKEKNIGFILDIVPNHMRINTSDNLWWMDLLKYGQKSKFAKFFDIDWEKNEKIVLPILDRPISEAVEKGLIKKEGEFLQLPYLTLPLNPHSDDLNEQNYVLEYWKKGLEKINYRRFFDISDLACLRIEDPEVFIEVHKKIFELIEEGLITGLRIDHIDGLKNPKKYLYDLKNAIKKDDFYIIAEKILLGDETLEKSWPLDGTTGYDFLNYLNGVFIDHKTTKIYHDFIGKEFDGKQLVYEAKKYILSNILVAEVKTLTTKLHKQVPSFSKDDTKKWLIHIIASFPVYRTYFEEDLNGFVGSFQQLTGPAMAKGLEDTACYRAFPLASVCEVGSNPYNFGLDLANFHQKNLERQKNFPLSLLATTTHDTKRSEDVRARINVLSEIPNFWQEAILRWNSSIIEDKISNNTKYLLYQTLVGTFSETEDPATYTDRIVNYMIKAEREGKINTNWLDPNIEYENILRKYIHNLFKCALFLPDFQSFMKPVIRAGYFNSLSQVLLKIASPGICDLYQGDEIFDFSLVDPDNRREVDFSARIDLLQQIKNKKENPIENYLMTPEDGRIKMYVTYKALESRRTCTFSDYNPFIASGEKEKHIIAFGTGNIIAIAGRFLYSMTPDFWQNTYLKIPPSKYRDVFTDRIIEIKDSELLISQTFKYMPLTLLERI